jgi:hypothetical protein
MLSSPPRRNSCDRSWADLVSRGGEQLSAPLGVKNQQTSLAGNEARKTARQ